MKRITVYGSVLVALALTPCNAVVGPEASLTNVVEIDGHICFSSRSA